MKKLIILLTCLVSFSSAQEYIGEPQTVQQVYVFTPAQFDSLIVKLSVVKMERDSLKHAISLADSIIALQDSTINVYEGTDIPWWEQEWFKQLTAALGGMLITKAVDR